MNLIFRLIYRVLKAFMGSKLNFMDSSVLRFRVWPHDLDLNFHMTNSRYLAIMDLGRLDHMIRTGVMGHMWRYGWRPVMGSVYVRYRRALNPFQRYHLCSKILAVDEKWFYFEHKMMTEEGDLACYALVKGIFVMNQESTIPAQEALKKMGLTNVDCSLLKPIEYWKQMEQTIAQDEKLKEFSLHSSKGTERKRRQKG